MVAGDTPDSCASASRVQSIHARAALICSALIIREASRSKALLCERQLHDGVPAIFKRQRNFGASPDALPALHHFNEALNSTLAMASDIRVEIKHSQFLKANIFHFEMDQSNERILLLHSGESNSFCNV